MTALFALILAFSAWAQQRPGASLEPPGKPVSVSYQAVLNCEPTFKDPRLEQEVDLKLLKDMIDNAYVTHRSLLMRRVVDFREKSGELRRLTLENYPEKGQSKFTALWQNVTPGGDTSPWEDSGLKKHPSLQEVHLAIAKGVIEKDETLVEDFKLKGVKLRSKKDLRQFLELRLEAEDGSKLLHCDRKTELGTICTCTKKSSPLRSR